MKKLVLVLLAGLLVVGCATVNTKPEERFTSLDPLRAVEILKQCDWYESRKMYPKETDPNPAKKGWIYVGESTFIRNKDCKVGYPVYEWYIERLTKEVIEQTDPETLEDTYKKWGSSKDLQIVEALIISIYGHGITNQWTEFVNNFSKTCAEQSENSSDVLQLRAIYWKCRFIEANSFHTIRNAVSESAYFYKSGADIPSVLRKLQARVTYLENKEKEKQRQLVLAEEQKRAEERRMEERKRAEERQREEQRQKQAAMEAERERLRKSYGGLEELSAFYLCGNPFKYQDKTVITILIFEKMLEKNVGVFVSYPGDCEILVSKLPSGLFTMSGQPAKLVVKVKGTTEVVTRAGTILKVPHVEYIGR